MLSFEIESESDRDLKRKHKGFSETEAIRIAEKKNCIVAFYR